MNATKYIGEGNHTSISAASGPECSTLVTQMRFFQALATLRTEHVAMWYELARICTMSEAGPH